jgi:dephospho-CoA kinase
MLIIGLTGGIGMGKSTAAKILRDLGMPVYYADRAVHGLLRKNGKAVKQVARLCPEAHRRGAIDRKILGRVIFYHPQKLKKLEKILHPLAQQIEDTFLKKARATQSPVAILEIPLLFETNGHKRCDYTICVTAPYTIQKARVMQRADMTHTKFRAILKRQMSDKLKRRRADYIVQTGKGYADTRKQLKNILAKIL